MRPIEFRAWDKDTETMFIPEYISGDGKVYEDIGVSFQQELSERKNVILLQFTGLKDRSGREIYEGDIVDYFEEVGAEKGEEKETVAEVKFGDGGFFIDGYRMFKDVKGYMANFIGPKWDKVKVIGNIYQNPELLEDQK